MKVPRLDRACAGFIVGVAAAIALLALLGSDPSQKNIILIIANGLVVAAVAAVIPDRFVDDTTNNDKGE